MSGLFDQGATMKGLNWSPGRVSSATLQKTRKLDGASKLQEIATIGWREGNHCLDGWHPHIIENEQATSIAHLGTLDKIPQERGRSNDPSRQGENRSRRSFHILTPCALFHG
jgi:hypothetical protein